MTLEHETALHATVSPLVKTQVNLFGHKLLDTASLTQVDTHARALCPQLSTRLTSSGRAFELLVPPVASRELHWCLQQWLHRTNHAREQVSCLTSNSSGRQTPILAFVPSFAGHSRSNLCLAFRLDWTQALDFFTSVVT